MQCIWMRWLMNSFKLFIFLFLPSSFQSQFCPSDQVEEGEPSWTPQSPSNRACLHIGPFKISTLRKSSVESIGEASNFFICFFLDSQREYLVLRVPNICLIQPFPLGCETENFNQRVVATLHWSCHIIPDICHQSHQYIYSGEKFVMWRKFRFICMTDVGNSEISLHLE